MIAELSERLQLARGRGGRAATAYWLAKRLLQVETYKFSATTLPAAVTPADTTLPTGYEFICIGSEADLARYAPALIDALSSNNGVSVEDTVAKGGRIYAIVCGERVITQQRVEFGRSYTGSPYPMDIYVPPGEAFFSYLYTQPSERGNGWARRLTAHITSHLAENGIVRCISHTRATNVGSLATRKRCGWKVVAHLYYFKPGKRGYLRRLSAWKDIGCQLKAVPVNSAKK